MILASVHNGGYAFLDHPRPLAFAHRGGAAAGLENSMTAFEQAVRMGYRYLETDVQATADGVPLAFHDSVLDRLTDRRGRVADLPYREVAKARIGGQEPIVLLEDLLAAFPEVRFNIDVKHPAAIDPLVSAIRRTGALDRVCVASFSDRRLAAVRAALGPQLCTSLGPREVFWLRTGASIRLLDRLVPRGIPCVQVPPWLPLLTRRFINHAHVLGMQVHVWTINDPVVMHRLLDLGVDGIMTDRIDTLRDVLTTRGAWTS